MAFVTFEGMDGCGKTTQVNRLQSDLSSADYDFCVTGEPGGTRISQWIREELLSPKFDEMCLKTEMLLFMAARAQHVGELIRPALDAGKVVLCSRYIDSSLVYQSFGQGSDMSEVRLLNDIATSGLKPDITFYLDIPVELGIDRMLKRGKVLDRMEIQDLAFFERIREGYLTLAGEEPDRFKIIDAFQSPEDVYKDIRAKLELFLGV